MIKRVVIYNSKAEPMSQAEIKKIIMQAQNITSTADYNKYYDRMRNKIINYQKIQVATGLKSQSEIVAPIKVLYNEAKRKLYAEKHDKEYKPSIFYKEVSKAPSLSTGKAIEKKISKLEKELKDIKEDTKVSDLSPELQAKRKSVLEYFGGEDENGNLIGLIGKVPAAKEAAEKIINPYQLEKALIDIAEKVKAILDDKKVRLNIPDDFITTSYSNISIDINSYLT